MYYEDLTNYQYLADAAESDALNIGWLDDKHYYEKGKCSEKFLDCLFVLCLDTINKTRGFHQCPFCTNKAFGNRVERNGKNVELGSAEIRVTGLNGKLYSCPDMIYHYVLAHEYLPPKEFIDAVLAQ